MIPINPLVVLTLPSAGTSPLRWLGTKHLGKNTASHPQIAGGGGGLCLNRDRSNKGVRISTLVLRKWRRMVGGFVLSPYAPTHHLSFISVSAVWRAVLATRINGFLEYPIILRET
jgi:hypothetical protein